ncbi:Alpha/Beta hydrolase protein [Sphaerosporella brunnea]|uniref:Carboxylic ester hydrolase n=1 Tax=Sphaerosporella brunnea TaxID=1250544 RepID=A0A5J5EX61_9PEZI|nr:Alpha/Beta hydrolase protein [Sphaerosporella brunnea]
MPSRGVRWYIKLVGARQRKGFCIAKASPPRKMHLLSGLLPALVLLGTASAAPRSHSRNRELPIVDLGYVRQQATEFNETAQVYIYRNVRFAAPPLGDLRLRKPQAPLKENGIQNGALGRDTACAQLNSTGALIGSEDCLFLDVYVPKAICGQGKQVPVLAWWYGGGYTNGAKDSDGSPWGIFDQASEPFIFVSSNYRLGTLGFIAPPDEDVDKNIGLHDTRMAMDWIGKYISKFGGDTEKITVMGISAGAGVILHQIVSYGGNGTKLPFQQAILQSPGWSPEANEGGRIPLWNAFKNNTGCGDATCIRKLSTAKVQLANVQTVAQWQSGALGSTSGLFPIVDGDFIPDFPVKLLADEKFHKEVKSIISSSTRYEGGYYVPTTVTDAQFPLLIASQFTTNQTIIQRLLAEYPSDGTPESGYKRAVAAVGDLAFNCNGYWVARAFSEEKDTGHSARRYMFNLGSAIHSSDLTYTFDDGGKYQAPNETLAEKHQRLIADFVSEGEASLSKWPEWSEESAKALWLNATGLAVGDDFYHWAVNVDRCEFIKDEILGKG